MSEIAKKHVQKEEVSKWSRFRHRYPYESEESVGLDFNFWVTNRYLNLEIVTDVLESCIFPANDVNKPTPLKSLSTIDNTVCLFLEDFDPCYYTDFCNNLSFFTHSTSVPIVSAKIETIKRELSAISNPSASNYNTTSTANSNAWFWNDVKHLPSLLFRPHFAFNFLTSENNRPLTFDFKDLMTNHQIAWQCQHALLNDMMIFTPEQYDLESLPIILEGAKAAFTLNRLEEHPIFSYLFDSKDYQQLLFGSFYIPRISSNGFYIAKIPSKETQINNDQPDWQRRIVLVLMWQNGVVDIFYEEEGDNYEELSEGINEDNNSDYTVNQYLSFKSNNMQGMVQSLNSTSSNADKEEEEENMRLTMISLRPLKYMDPITPPPSSTSTNSTNPVNIEDNSSAVDIIAIEANKDSAEANTSKETSSFQNPQQLLESLKSNYELSRLSIEDFTPFILSNDVLEMLGYLLDATYVQCLDSSNPTQWKFRDGNNPFLLKAAQEEAERKALVASKSRFGGLALEEGEEEEEGEEREEKEVKKEENAVRSLPPLLQKLKEQALIIFPFDTILHQLPYQQFLFPSSSSESSEPSVFPLDLCAIDCEMCSTRDGLELTRITILHPLHGVIIDTLVKPKLPITDYHTEFSGVTEESLRNITITLQDVQDFLPLIISKDTILIGHSLDNDLKALRIVHHRIIDTAALFPHDQGLPHKIALKKLAKDYLHIDIQDGVNGHDSIQDSVTSLELLILQVKYWKEEILEGNAVRTQPVRNESMLKELLAPSDALTEAASNTLTSLTSPSTSTMKFTFFDYLLYRRKFVKSNHKMPETLSIHVSHQLPYADRPSWERVAFGYRKEGDLTTLVEQFQSQLNVEALEKEQSIRIESSINRCENWKEVLVSMLKQGTQTEGDEGEGKESERQSHRVFLGSISLKEEIIKELTALKQDLLKEGEKKEDQQSNKRRKIEVDSSISMMGEEGNNKKRTSFFQLFSEALELFYQSLPEQTMLMVFTQRDLKEMRKLIAKKIRYKWENAPAQPSSNNTNSITTTSTTQPSSNSNDAKKKVIQQKRPRVIVPLKPGISIPNNNGNSSGGGGVGNKRQFQQNQSQAGAILGYDWDPSNDENKLIEETNRVASSVLYMRYK